jgi:hypothetical protein
MEREPKLLDHRELRDMVLEEAAQIAEANGGEDAAGIIRSHASKINWERRMTPIELQKQLGDSQAGSHDWRAPNARRWPEPTIQPFTFVLVEP